MFEEVQNSVFSDQLLHQNTSINSTVSQQYAHDMSQIILSQELKMLRLRISDYNKSPAIDAICQKVRPPLTLKIWKLIIVHQYDEILLELVPHHCALPLQIDLYLQANELFKVALGIYFQTSYYVARNEHSNGSIQSNVFYQRFMYDLISMFGLNLFYIELPTLEFLIRKLYVAVSYKDGQQLRLLALDSVRPAFTEEQFNQVVLQKMKSGYESKAVSVPETVEQNEFVLSDLVAVGKNAMNLIQENRKQKKILVHQQNQIKKGFVPFQFQLGAKWNPVETLQSLKKQKIQPLLVASIERPIELSTEEPSTLSYKPLRTPVESLRKIHESKPHRQHTLRIYEHIQAFNTVDLDETIDLEEKFKKQLHHDQIMKKLGSRPDPLKLKQFLKYEALNTKSHLFNQAHKTDKMFRELNAVQYKHKEDQNQTHMFRLYQPLIELKKDEYASQTSEMLIQQKPLWQPLVEQEKWSAANIRVNQDQNKHLESERSSHNESIFKPRTVQQSLEIQGFEHALPSIVPNLRNPPNVFKSVNVKDINKTNQRYHHLKPTKLHTLREKFSKNLNDSIQSEKPRVWLNDVTMGDFQLQSWRNNKKVLNSIE